MHSLPPTESATLRQRKRSPSNPAASFLAQRGAATVEQGSWAENPYLAVTNSEFGIAATIARLEVRDPQGLVWNQATNELENRVYIRANVRRRRSRYLVGCGT